MLVFASYVFYAAWNVKFALLMLGTTSVDYWTGKFITSGRNRRAWLAVAFAIVPAIAGFSCSRRSE